MLFCIIPHYVQFELKAPSLGFGAGNRSLKQPCYGRQRAAA
uniref:Uncharacterized protein n=2 Tax=Vibrio TaxID=662 RepID=A0A0H3ZP60_9VIBR|nr:hypothetical protein [Vibrio kanaloae]AKN38288.1 hypothetical protein [Vibrio sp. 1S_269]AKN37391.1 hypothetical protein [Vibrio kanaloae]AKN37797.1 hypothetical protein [Vibrio kanaloae]AKN38885.1 hypothetical protein [Vibrio kanaloae]